MQVSESHCRQVVFKWGIQNSNCDYVIIDSGFNVFLTTSKLGEKNPSGHVL